MLKSFFNRKKNKSRIKNIKSYLIRFWFEIIRLPWEDISIGLVAIFVFNMVSYQIRRYFVNAIEVNTILSNLLVINGVFSAILLTYLFSRITWSKDRKYEALKDAFVLSQKLTEFRRILNTLIGYYNVWQDDNATKSLFDSGKYRTVDYCDFRSQSLREPSPKDSPLIDELKKEQRFSEGISTLYLAMISLVKDRRRTDFHYQEELQNDYEFKGLYDIRALGKWIDQGIFGTIWYRLNSENPWIRYSALDKKRIKYIHDCAVRINSKYESYTVDNTLIKELAGDFNEKYAHELYEQLVYLKKGIRGINVMLVILISCSLLIGVLCPLLLLLMPSQDYWYKQTLARVAAANAAMISYFLIKFPFQINRELKLY
jgi:hypothetical protein